MSAFNPAAYFSDLPTHILPLRSARVQGLEKDLGLVGTQFNTAISILFVGYILGQVPSNLILSRVRPSLYLSGFVALWGAVSMSTALADNYTHLIVIRFFLGVTESPYFPGALFLLSSWYPKKVSRCEAGLSMSYSLFFALVLLGTRCRWSVSLSNFSFVDLLHPLL